MVDDQTQLQNAQEIADFALNSLQDALDEIALLKRRIAELEGKD